MPIDPNSLPRIEPLEPDSLTSVELKVTGLVSFQTVGTGSLLSAGVQGASYGHGSDPEVIN